MEGQAKETVSSKEPSSRGERLERSLVSAFEPFLERLGKLQPLIVLFSLSIVVATFSRQVSQGAFVWGMAAAFSFGLSLLASAYTMFVLSVPEPGRAKKPQGAMPFVFIYTSAAVGFASLGFLLLTFAREMPDLGRLEFFLGAFVFGASFAMSGFTILARLAGANPPNWLYVALKYVTIGAAFALLLGPFFFILRSGEWSELGQYLFLAGLAAMTALLVVTFRMERKQKKDRQRPRMNGGSAG